MSNNLICDFAGIAPDARRIKDHGTVIAAGFLRLTRHVWMSNRFCLFGWLYLALPCDGWSWRDGLLVDLPPRYIRPHEQTGIVSSQSNPERSPR
jgi:hypothetical protein